MSNVDQLAREFLRRNSELDPSSATQLGILGHDGELTDYSPAGEEARGQLLRDTLRQLDGLGPAADRERVASAQMRDRLQVQLDFFEAGEWLRDLGVFGPMVSISRVFDLMARDGDDDWELIARRMEQVPAALAGLRQTLELGRGQKLVSDRHQVEITAARARRWAGADSQAPFFRTLAGDYPGGRPALRDRLRPTAEAADRAYLDFAEYLEREYLPAAREEEGCGEEIYRLGCRLYNGIDLDLLQTYAWGWEELARIEGEVDGTVERIQPGATFPEVTRLLDTDPERSIEGEQNFLAWNQELLDQTMVALNGVHFDIPKPVQRVEAMLAPPGGMPAMYYTPPSQDFSRPGRTWYPTLGRTRFPLWVEVSVAFHEGVPGHHLQLGHLCWLGDRLNPFQGVLGLLSGHAEGWALYAELLMGELGFLENPDYYLGMLAMQGFRAARVVVDIGLHLHLELPADQPFHPGERWTRQLAVEFLTQLAGKSREFCQGEVDRYLGTPGQAISYKVGERVWLEVREEARRSWGPQFNLKDFHRQALDLGSVGLQQLREEMAKPRPAPVAST